MSKGQRGNQEPKKPKKVQAPIKPLVPTGALPAATTASATPKQK